MGRSRHRVFGEVRLRFRSGPTRAEPLSVLEVPSPSRDPERSDPDVPGARPRRADFFWEDVFRRKRRRERDGAASAGGGAAGDQTAQALVAILQENSKAQSDDLDTCHRRAIPDGRRAGPEPNLPFWYEFEDLEAPRDRPEGPALPEAQRLARRIARRLASQAQPWCTWARSRSQIRLAHPLRQICRVTLRHLASVGSSRAHLARKASGGP